MSLNLEGFEIRPAFITKLLRNPDSATPLTGTEVDIAAHSNILRQIQEEMDMDLLLFLQRTSPYVSLRDQLFFLLDAFDQEVLQLAIDTLEVAYENQTKMSAAGLVKIMQENSEYAVMPSLMVGLLGEQAEPEPEEYYNQVPQPKKSSLNLDAMRDFR